MKLEAAEDYTNTFIILGKYKILPTRFAINLAKVIGLRNKIIHKYDIIDMKKFINNLKENSKQFENYVKYIYNYIKKQ